MLFTVFFDSFIFEATLCRLLRVIFAFSFCFACARTKYAPCYFRFRERTPTLPLRCQHSLVSIHPGIKLQIQPSCNGVRVYFSRCVAAQLLLLVYCYYYFTFYFSLFVSLYVCVYLYKILYKSLFRWNLMISQQYYYYYYYYYGGFTLHLFAMFLFLLL